MKYQIAFRTCVAVAILSAATSISFAQHGGGHGGGGHGGGHGGGGHGGGHFGGYGDGHGGGHFGGYGGGHFGGYGGSHYGGHGVGGHGGFGYGGGGHGGFGHGGGHHGSGLYTHQWYPSFGFYVSPSYGGFGYSSYYAPNTYSSSYVAGYRGVENTATVAVEQPILSEPAPPIAIQQTAARPVTTSEGEAFRRKAEAAFRAGDFQRAAKMANHALVEMPRDGKLLLFAAQTLFAIGDYRSAAVVIHQAASQLDPQQWGYVVENYRQYYRGRAFVDQMDRLNEYIKKNSDADYAYFLRGYQHGFLKHHPAALKDLNKTVALESRDQMAAQLITRFGGTPPASLEQPTLELSPAVDSAPSSTSSENIDEQSLTESKESSDDHESDSHEHDH